LLSVLLLGTALNAFYIVGYIHWLVLEKVHRLLLVNTAALVLSLAISPLLITRLGPIGAAFGWLAINLIGFFLSLEWLKNPHNERTP
jgi:O-antigen/teichoic acid export membrane protein